MNKLYKLLFFMTFILITGLLICSCNKGEKNSDSTNTDNVSETVNEGSDELVTIENINEYRIICSDRASNSVNRSVFKIRDVIKEKEGVSLECSDDFINKDSDEPIYRYEILVGDTNREESSVGDLDPFKYIIKYADGKIVIKAGSDSALSLAAKYFTDKCLKEGKIVMPKELVKDAEVSQIGERGVPSFSIDFNTLKDGQYVSSDGSSTTKLVNCSEVGGYNGNALRFHGTVPMKGGAMLKPGATLKNLDGASSYTVTMWLMPYQSYHGSRTYRVLTVVGGKNNMMLTVDYSSPLIRVHAEAPLPTGVHAGQTVNKDRQVTLDFPYALDTVIPPFDSPNTNDGVWQFVAVTVDFKENTVKLFVNGEEIRPSDKKSFDFGNAKIDGNAKVKFGDCIGGDPGGQQRSFNGLIDCYNVYNSALTKEELQIIEHSYGNSDTPSITEDQAILDGISERLGSGIAVLGNSANAVFAKRVVKADTRDYKITNPIIDGEVYITENLLERFTDKAVNDGKKTVDGVNYYSAKAVAKALGLDYIDKASENGMFIILAADSKMTADDKTAIDRLSTFCTVKENEPRINAEQTRRVIATSDTKNGDYTYSPSIVKKKIGNTIYASRDISCRHTDVFASEDNGETWEHRGKIEDLRWATIFEHKGDLYLIGSYKQDTKRYIGVTRSTDGGRTWTPINSEIGGVVYNGGYAVHCGPTPVVKANGKIYRVFESTEGEKREFVAMCDENADLTDPKNWTFSTYFSHPSFPNEGNAVVSKDGDVFVLARFGTETAYLMRLLSDNTLVSIGKIDFPSSANKFTCRYDEKTGKYLAIVCPLIDKDLEYQRNYSALAVSDDLQYWKICEMLLCDRELVNPFLSISQHAFQYVDWVFDGDDILLAVRESAEDAANFHDSNYLTMYRIENYAEIIK